MKKVLLILSLLTLCISVFAAEDLTFEPKARATAEEFTIMPYGYDFNLDLDRHLADLYDCGFNVSTFIEPDRVALAKKHNLKAIVYGGNHMDNSITNLNKRAKAWTDKLNKIIGKENMKDVYQIVVKDEPFLTDMEYITVMSNAVIDNMKCKPYINLNPNYAPESLIGPSYEDYATNIIKACRLDYLSYDNYSIFAKKGMDEDRFYGNLEEVRKVCTKTNSKLVNIICSVAHFNYAEPTDYSINIQGWSTLAYGGRGLSYFTFHTANRGNYRAGAYDRYGQKTETYEIIKRMNMNIHHIMPYYKDLEFINAFHVGNVPKGSKGKESAQVIKEVACIYDNPNRFEGTPNFLVGEFRNRKDGKYYVIIVNKESELSLYCNWMTFKNDGKPYHIKDMSLEGEGNAWEGEDRWIAPGHGMLIRVD